MADTKISALASAAALTGVEAAPVVQAAATVKATAQQFVTLANGSTGVTGATVTTSNPLLNHAQTWNAGAITFTGWTLNVTDTASAAASLLVDYQVGGVSKFSVSKSGGITNPNSAFSSIGGVGLGYVNPGVISFPATGMFGIGTSINNVDAAFARKAAKVLELNSGIAGTYPGTALLLGLQTVAQLPVASTAAGMRATVSDATAPTFGATVAGAGAVVTPVYSDGTNWKVG